MYFITSRDGLEYFTHISKYVRQAFIFKKRDFNSVEGKFPITIVCKYFSRNVSVDIIEILQII